MQPIDKPQQIKVFYDMGSECRLVYSRDRSYSNTPSGNHGPRPQPRSLRMLNSVLATELGTTDLYTRCLDLPSNDCFLRGFENHQDNCNLLRRLIIINSGIPNFESTTFSTELCLFAKRVGSQFGRTISRVTAIKLCENMEHHLRKRYLDLLEHAPLRDKGYLQDLLLTTKSNLISIEKNR